MNARKTISLLILLLSFAAGCEWPADPPLKSAVPQPPDTTDPADTIKVLLPLDPRLSWTYVVTSNVRPPQAERRVSPVPIDWQNIRFYEVEYAYYTTSPGMQPLLAFPPILKNTRTGLSFFQLSNPQDSIVMTSPPRLAYHLPYPAKQGAIWNSPNEEYQVRLLNVDTLVTDFSTMMTFRVWRYRITRQRQLETEIYAIPGVAFLRVEDMMFRFHTIGWTVK